MDMRTEEEKRNLKILGMLLILAGISINFYLLWEEGQKTAVTNTIVREGINAIGRIKYG